ncbi:MAG: DUF885 family protein, partial [candidate division Zixibacteria bacterium]|nr:DUF885 family protein [candidate division Zixibacteria bacterium]
MNQYDDKAFEGLVENILEETWEFSPFTATFMGIHKYDHLLDQVDKETRKAYLVKQHSQLALLDAFKYGGNINSDNLLDLEILQCNLKTRIATEEMFNRFERDPSLYPNMAIFACFILVLREFLPIEERCRALISRLREIPRFLTEAEENLMPAETIPSIWLDMAREMTISGQKYFAELVIPDVPAIAHLKDEVGAASALALKAFDDYLQFLNEKLSRKPQGSFAAGREYFDFLLSNYHLLPYTSEELETIGLEYIEKTSDEMRRLA